jgi:hypothetical protein
MEAYRRCAAEATWLPTYLAVTTIALGLVRTQLAAFGAQVIVWGLIWTWHAHRAAA